MDEHGVLLLFESFGDLPPPHVLLPPLCPTPTILTTRLFSRYTTFFQGYVPADPRGSDFSFSTHVDCIRGRGDSSTLKPTRNCYTRLLRSIRRVTSKIVCGCISEESQKHQESREDEERPWLVTVTVFLHNRGITNCFVKKLFVIFTKLIKHFLMHICAIFIEWLTI